MKLFEIYFVRVAAAECYHILKSVTPFDLRGDVRRSGLRRHTCRFNHPFQYYNDLKKYIYIPFKSTLKLSVNSPKRSNREKVSCVESFCLT